MMREDNLQVLTECTPRSSRRMMEIIKEGYLADFDNDSEFERWFDEVEKREKRRFPTRTQVQVISNLNHIKMLLKSHYNFRFETYKKYNK